MTHTVHAGDAVESDELVDTLLLAFHSDPLVRWFFPTPTGYLKHFPGFVENYGGTAFDCGEAYYTGEKAGVALWSPPGEGFDEGELLEFWAEVLSPEKQQEAWPVFEDMERTFPDEPHWHLTFLGVGPTKQNKGHGSALLEGVLERCDERGETAYLESSNPRNLSLYTRHGFEPLGVVRVEPLPPVFPMVREPKG